MDDGGLILSDSAKDTAQLIKNARDVYGDRFQQDLFEQYKLYVDSAQKVSESRVSASNYLLTVNSLLLTVFGFVITQTPGRWLLAIPAAGLLVSMAWYSMVRSYKDLNGAKFKVIHELEQQLPAALFAYEWYYCDHGRGKKYRPITHIERWIPCVFAAMYVALGVLAFTGFSSKHVEPSKQVIKGSSDVNLQSPCTASQPQTKTSK
jgi:hypothetical protein